MLRLIKGAAGRNSRPEEPELLSRTTAAKDREESLNLTAQPKHFGLLRLRLFERVFRLESINLILRSCLIVLALFFIFDLVYSSTHMRGRYQEGTSGEKEGQILPFPRTLNKEFSHYIANTQISRDIFAPSQKTTGSLAASRLGSRQEYVSNLKLLGIISGAKPQAIIEDQAEQKSYSVSVGDYLEDFLVEEVAAGRVRLGYKGAKFDLFL